MKRLALGAMAALLICGAAPAASAGVYADDLSKCLVKSSNAADSNTLAQWMFSLLALNPSVKGLSDISPARREAIDRNMAALFSRLLFKDCRKESMDALKYEGASAMEGSFQVFGAASTRSLMSDPAVAGGLAGFTKFVDNAEMVKLMTEAGAAPAKP